RPRPTGSAVTVLPGRSQAATRAAHAAASQISRRRGPRPQPVVEPVETTSERARPVVSTGPMSYFRVDRERDASRGAGGVPGWPEPRVRSVLRRDPAPPG